MSSALRFNLSSALEYDFFTNPLNAEISWTDPSYMRQLVTVDFDSIFDQNNYNVLFKIEVQLPNIPDKPIYELSQVNEFRDFADFHDLELAVRQRFYTFKEYAIGKLHSWRKEQLGTAEVA